MARLREAALCLRRCWKRNCRHHISGENHRRQPDAKNLDANMLAYFCADVVVPANLTLLPLPRRSLRAQLQRLWSNLYCPVEAIGKWLSPAADQKMRR